MLISTRCIHGYMSNLIKKSWTDSSLEACLIYIFLRSVIGLWSAGTSGTWPSHHFCDKGLVRPYLISTGPSKSNDGYKKLFWFFSTRQNFQMEFWISNHCVCAAIIISRNDNNVVVLMLCCSLSSPAIWSGCPVWTPIWNHFESRPVYLWCHGNPSHRNEMGL